MFMKMYVIEKLGPAVGSCLGCLVPRQELHCWQKISQQLSGILDLVNANFHVLGWLPTYF